MHLPAYRTTPGQRNRVLAAVAVLTLFSTVGLRAGLDRDGGGADTSTDTAANWDLDAAPDLSGGTAVVAARLGAKTCLNQDRPVFGGNSSSEIRVTPQGAAAFRVTIAATHGDSSAAIYEVCCYGDSVG